MTMHQIRTAVVLLALLTALTGFLYPLAVTGIAQLLFPAKANGSLIVRDGKVVGSELIGQPFRDPAFFWGRLSATSPFPYNAAASSGSNLGPLNETLHSNTQARIADLRSADPDNRSAIPIDLVTASGSGLDPHISPAAARYQVSRVARARGLSREKLEGLIAECTDGRSLGLLGEPGVNVLRLNLALEDLAQREGAR